MNKESAIHNPTSKKRIMVVEDEGITAMRIRDSLEDLGYTVVSIEITGEDAVQKSSEERPDLVLMDITLGGEIDGIDAAGRIRTGLKIPVVFVTAHSEDIMFKRAKETAPFGYVIKPFTDRELSIAVEMAFYIHRTEEELTEHRERLEELVRERTAELSAASDLLLEEIEERKRKEKTLKESEMKVRDLYSRLINAQEKERRRISMELHDELGQALNVIKLRIKAIENGVMEEGGPMQKECAGLREYVDRLIEDVRRISLDLSPTVLDDIGLTSAIQWIISDVRKNSDINILLELPAMDDLFTRDHWITVYRIIQEALTNVMKHARARKVSVVIRRRDDSVLFVIEDDGQGFAPGRAAVNLAPQKGMGLSTMNERVMMMGGSLDIKSRKGHGTSLTFSVPVEKGRE